MSIIMQMILGGSIFPQSLQDNPRAEGALSREFPKLYVAKSLTKIGENIKTNNLCKNCPSIKR